MRAWVGEAVEIRGSGIRSGTPRARTLPWGMIPLGDATCTDTGRNTFILSSGTPRPLMDWNVVGAGLLALGSVRSAGLPGRIQWQGEAERSPMTVAGAAPDFWLGAGHRIPF